MRYFVRCKYKGTHFHGWQIQSNTPETIQGHLERAIALVTRVETTIVGCGRTDVGVHAFVYYFHFDTEYRDPQNLRYKINQITPDDIYCAEIIKVESDAHARYDAIERGYTYYISKERIPFTIDTTYTHVKIEELNLTKLNVGARLLLGKHSFDTFCKTHTDVKTKICTIKKSEWIETETGYQYQVRADRYLRGMVRLIVGMCINISRDRLTAEEVISTMERQERLSLDWSVPAKGLFLDYVGYREGWLSKRKSCLIKC